MPGYRNRHNGDSSPANDGERVVCGYVNVCKREIDYDALAFAERELGRAIVARNRGERGARRAVLQWRKLVNDLRR